MIVQGMSLAAAGVVLFAFWMQQSRRWHGHEVPYLLCNGVGTAVLTAVAWIGSQWGFVLVEAVWALVSFNSLRIALTGGARPT